MNNKFSLIVFDLDGTLVDSSNNIHTAATKTFEKLGMKVDFPKAELDKRIGAHFQDIFNDLNIIVDDIESYIEIYKEFYFQFIGLSVLYPGVVQFLSLLKRNGVATAILTTKAQGQVKKIVKHFNLDPYFDIVSGRKPGVELKPHPQPLQIIMNEAGLSPSQTLMVGDSEFDIGCGKNAGVKTVAATYGYRNIDDLKKLNPDYLISDIGELKSIVFE